MQDILTQLFQSLATTAGIQQQQVTKLVTAAGKPVVAGAATTATANLRMIGPAAGGLNLAHIGGKPVLLASKAQSTPIQGPTGQVITNRAITVMLSILYRGHGLTSTSPL
jgi:hypothetical protein